MTQRRKGGLNGDFLGFLLLINPPKQEQLTSSSFLPDVQADIVDRTSTSGYLTRNGKRIIKEKRDGTGALLFAFIAIIVKIVSNTKRVIMLFRHQLKTLRNGLASDGNPFLTCESEGIKIFFSAHRVPCLAWLAV